MKLPTMLFRRTLAADVVPPVSFADRLYAAALRPKRLLLVDDDEAFARIFEAKSKRWSNKVNDWGRVLVDLAKSWTKKHLATKQAKLIGRKGGRNKGKNLKKRRLPEGDVAKHWYDKTISEDEAIARINEAAIAGGYTGEWTRSTLRRHFDPRGTPTGPRSKK